MPQRIIRIENAGPAFRARRIFFEDDQLPRTTASAVVKKLGIVVGDEVDRPILEATLRAEELPLAKERALQLIGYRERSVAELESKLRDSGFPIDIAAAVVERFREVELVDDARFASAWVRSRKAAGYGSRRISRELADKGVAAEIVEAVLAPTEGDADEVSLAVRSLRGRTPRDRADSQRLIRRLLGRGFDLSAARSAVEIAQRAPGTDSDGNSDPDTYDYLR